MSFLTRHRRSSLLKRALHIFGTGIQRPVGMAATLDRAISLAPGILVARQAQFATGLNQSLTLVPLQKSAATPSTSFNEAFPLIGAGIAPTKFVRATGAGTGDGSSFANAAPFSSINTVCASLASTGGVIALLATDTYSMPSSSGINITNGGPAGQPIIITGMNSDFTYGDPTILGNRGPTTGPAWTLPLTETRTSVSGWAIGPKCFRVQASNLIFQHLRFERVELAFDFNAASLVENVIVQDCSGYNLRRFQDHSTAGSGGAHALNNIIFRRISTVGNSKACYRFRGFDLANAATNILLEDIDANGGWQDRDAWGNGIQFDDYAHDCTVNRMTAYNMCDTTASYWNGDGFTGERTNYKITLNDCISHGNTDGGFDFKSQNVVFNNCESYDCRRGWRMWGYDWVANNCYSHDAFVRQGGGGGPDAIWMNEATIADTIGSFGTWNGGKLKGNLTIDSNAVLRMIGVDESDGTTDVLANSTGGTGTTAGLILRGATAVAGNPSLTSPTLVGGKIVVSVNEGIAFSQALTFDRAVTMELLNNADGFALTNGYASPLKLSAQSYVAGGDNLRTVTVRARDLDNSYTDYDVEVTIAQVSDARVFDVTWTGSDGSQTATDVFGHPATWGSLAKIDATTFPQPRLKSIADTPGDGFYRVTFPDSDDWNITGPWTLVIENLCVASILATNQDLVAHWRTASGQRDWVFYVTSAGKLAFTIGNGNTSVLNVIGATTILTGTSNSYADVRVVRSLISGTNFRWSIYINGVEDAGQPSTVVPITTSGALLSINNSGSSDAPAGAWQGRTVIHKGAAVLT